MSEYLCNISVSNINECNDNGKKGYSLNRLFSQFNEYNEKLFKFGNLVKVLLEQSKLVELVLLF